MTEQDTTVFLTGDQQACISALPTSPGSYALQLKLNQPEQIQVGKFAQVEFPPGIYIYLGSALGPGGLRARLGRHIMGSEKPHWHIDYLRRFAELQAIHYLLAGYAIDGLAVECAWSQMLSKFPEADIPLAGFGSRDCHSGCRAHLVRFPSTCTNILSRMR